MDAATDRLGCQRLLVAGDSRAEFAVLDAGLVARARLADLAVQWSREVGPAGPAALSPGHGELAMGMRQPETVTIEGDATQAGRLRRVDAPPGS